MTLLVVLLAADRIHEGLFQAAASHALNTMHSFQAQSVSAQVLWSCYAVAAPAFPSTCNFREHTALRQHPLLQHSFVPRPPVSEVYDAQ